MKYTAAFFILQLLIGFAHAQTRISGEMRSNEGKALAFANALLLKAKDSTLVKGSVATENGFYVIENVKEGNYLVVASMVGFAKAYSKSLVISNAQKEIVLPTLVADELTGQLKEVAIVAKKPLFEQQIDRMVVNVASSITAAGGTALEVLERSPGVTVNRQGNSLLMSGKSGVMVMLDGKLTRLPMDAVLQLLEGMSASNIEKIELITTPPARYDAEGDAGLINIITKRNPNYGFNGTLSATWGQGRYIRPAASTTLSYRNQRLNLFGDYSFINNQNWRTFDVLRTTENKGIITQSDAHFSGLYKYPNHFAKVGFEYGLNTSTILGGLVSVFSTESIAAPITTSEVYENSQLITESRLNIMESNLWRHLMLNLNVRHTFKNKQEWGIDVDRLYYDNQQPTSYLNQDIAAGVNTQSEFRTIKRTPVQMWVMKTDYFTKIGKKTRFDIGLKASLTDLDNDVKMERRSGNKWQDDAQFSQHFLFKEDILAGYFSSNSTISPKTTLQVGLRYEHTATDVTDSNGKIAVHRRYSNFFPNVFVSYKLDKSHAFNLAYSRRITRPSYNNLAPFVIFVNQNTYFYGNPALFPTISNTVQGSYVFKDNYIFSLRYSYDQNVIALFQPKFDAIANQFYFYPENIDGVKTVAFTTTVPLQFTKWWQSQNTLTGYWQSMQTIFQDAPFTQNLWSFQLNTTHSFALPRQFRIELSCFYISPSLLGITHVLSKSEITVGIQKTLSNNKGTLRLTISDIFWRNYFRWQMDVPASNLSIYTTIRNEPRVVRLTYNRSFGNQKVKVNQNRKTGSEEERQRL